MEHDTKHTKLGGLQLRSILRSNRAGELLVIREARFSDRTLVFRFLKNFCIKKHRQLSDPSTGLNKAQNFRFGRLRHEEVVEQMSIVTKEKFSVPNIPLGQDYF